MTDGDRDDRFSIDPEDLDMLREMFGITTSEQERRFKEVIRDLEETYGFVDKQILVQRLMSEFGIDSEFFDQIQQDMADLNMDHLDHLLDTPLKFDYECNICHRSFTELCEHLQGQDRLEILLQMGEVDKGLALLNKLGLNQLDEILWQIRFLIIDHDMNEIKQLLDEGSQIIYDDNDEYNIFRLQVLKIHYLLDQRQYDEALRVADSISPFADQLENNENPEISYWMASLSQGMASALLKMGQVKVALDPLLVATDIFIEIKNQYQVAVSFALISSVMGILQEGNKAHDAARLALQLMGQLDNDFGLIRVKTFIASGFLSLFETDIAMDYASEALESAIEMEKNTIIAALYGLISQIHLIEHNYNEALVVADKCLEYAEDQNISEIRAIAVSLKGDIEAEQNHIDNAIEYYERAIEMLVDGRDDQIILDLDRRIAELERLR